MPDADDVGDDLLANQFFPIAGFVGGGPNSRGNRIVVYAVQIPNLGGQLPTSATLASTLNSHRLPFRPVWRAVVRHRPKYVVATLASGFLCSSRHLSERRNGPGGEQRTISTVATNSAGTPRHFTHPIGRVRLPSAVGDAIAAPDL